MLSTRRTSPACDSTVSSRPVQTPACPTGCNMLFSFQFSPHAPNVLLVYGRTRRRSRTTTETTEAMDGTMWSIHNTGEYTDETARVTRLTLRTSMRAQPQAAAAMSTACSPFAKHIFFSLNNILKHTTFVRKKHLRSETAIGTKQKM